MDCFNEKLTLTPILQGPNWTLPFHTHTNASDNEIWKIFGQKEDKIPYAIYFINKNFSNVILNFKITKKEFIVVIRVVNNFRNYVNGYHFFTHTNHFVINYLMNKHYVNISYHIDIIIATLI